MDGLASGKPKVVFFGNERLATGVTTSAPVLRALIKAGYEVVAVVSHHSESTSRSGRILEVAEVAGSHDIPVLLPEKPSDIADDLQQLGADIGVLAAYGKIVPQSVIDIFPHGIVNLHPSLLPLHRGPIPLESVILDGSNETGVSIMGLVKAMDAGPVYAQKQVALTGSETKQELADELGTIGADLMLEVLATVFTDQAHPQQQDETKATYDQLITKEAGIIDWHKPAKVIEREIRAYAVWPKSSTLLADKGVVITSAIVRPAQSVPGKITVEQKQLLVGCGKESLEILKLKPAGKAEMTAQAFLAGHKNKIQP